jgi:hypothetical protein
MLSKCLAREANAARIAISLSKMASAEYFITGQFHSKYSQPLEAIFDDYVGLISFAGAGFRPDFLASSLRSRSKDCWQAV